MACDMHCFETWRGPLIKPFDGCARRKPMRITALLFAGVLAIASTAAAQSAPSSDALPVSLDKIRVALQNAPAEPLRGLDTQPNFSTQIRERQKIEELLATIKVPSGPGWPIGPYAAELNRITNNPVDNPLRQPFAEFSQSELLAIAIENIVGRYFVENAYASVQRMHHQRAEQGARMEVMRAIAQYCGAQPQSGAGIPSCSSTAQTGTR